MNITFDPVKQRQKTYYIAESIRVIYYKFDSYLKELTIGINDKIVWNNNVPSLDNNVLQDCSQSINY